MSADELTDFTGGTVWTKAAWVGSWIERTTLQPISAVNVCAPEYGQAIIRQHIGSHNLADRTAFAAEAALDLRDHYVKIVNASDSSEWVGIITEQSTEWLGFQAADPTGIRTYVARSLDHLLDMTPIVGSWCSDDGATVYQIDRSLTFNISHERGGTLIGNRSAAKIGLTPMWYFTLDGSEWTIKNILEYVLDQYAGSMGFLWELGGQIDDLDQLTTIVSLDGLTVRQALNKLIDRRRGYGWTLRMVGSEPQDVRIHVFSLFTSDVNVGGFTFTENAEQGDVDLGAKHLIKRILVSSDYSRAYNKIRVQGRPVKACFDVRTGNAAPLRAAWSVALLDEYKEGAKNIAGYAGWPLQTQQEENDRVRARERYRDVFAKWEIDPDWDWETFVSGPLGDMPVALSIASDGDFILNGKLQAVASDVYPGTRPFLPFLPLKEGVDYSTAGWEAAVTDTLPFRAPFVTIPHPLHGEVLSGSDGPFVYIHDMQQPDIPNGRVSMENRGTAIRIQFSPNYLFAANGPAEPGEPAEYWGDPPEHEPGVYQNIWWYDAVRGSRRRFWATICIELDTRLVVEIACGSAPSTDFDRDLVIDVPDAELWYAMVATVVGIEKDGRHAYLLGDEASPNAVLDSGHAVAMVLRDDSPRLRALALLAKEWYGIAHSPAKLQTHQVKDYGGPGQYYENAVVDGGADVFAVNSIVTKQAWDYEQGTTSIETAWWDVDWSRIVAVNVPGYGSQPEFVRDILRMAKNLEAARQTEGA